MATDTKRPAHYLPAWQFRGHPAHRAASRNSRTEWRLSPFRDPPVTGTAFD